MKKILLILITITSFSVSYSQEIFEKVSKQYSFETGYQYNYKSGFDSLSSRGYSFLADYAWKLSGYNKKPAVYLSVPMGYTYFPSDNQSGFKSFSVLNYGWTVRHEILKDKKFIPFAGYALLLNQIRIEDEEGSSFGHQTKFELGMNYYLKEKFVLYLKTEYSLRRFPTIGETHAKKMQSIELKLGVRF